MFRARALASLLLLLFPVLCPSPLRAATDFSRDILPILSNHCFQCHGPDQANRQAGLRLDVETEAKKALESGATAVVAGKSDVSELIKRIRSADPDLQMPPAETGKPLSEAQKKRLEAWIAEGAPWGGHWAFQPPTKGQPPAAVDGWEANGPIDQYIHRLLKRANLQPSDQADKATLLRRVTLDLTGLPPTLAEWDAFLADDSPEAFERVVDRLLGSVRYGEHMARIWLDAARYGDTHGLHLDNERSIWPYRDWVIQSFANNQPFDQFTIEQIAGDLLPSPTLKQRVATGFNRCNVTTSEGGSIDDEYYARYAVDRVETTATVWLGLTAGCAACHDHKFDPLTQKEFYQLFSYYFSLTERAMDGNALLPPPVVKVPTADQEQAMARYRKEAEEAKALVAKILSEFEYQDPSPEGEIGELSEQERIWFDDSLPAGAVAQGNGPNPWNFVGGPDHPVHSGDKSTVRKGEGDAITQHFFTGAKEKLKISDNTRLFAYVYLDPKNPPKTIQLQFNDGSWDHRASWGEDKAFNAGRNDNTNRLMGKLPEAGKWVRVEVAASQVGLKAGSELNGWAFTQVGGEVHWDSPGIIDRALGEEQKKSLHIWEQFRKLPGQGKLAKDIQAILDLESAKRNDQQKQKLTRYFLEQVHPEAQAKLKDPIAQQKEADRKLSDVEKAIPATLVMEDRKQPRQAHVLERGEYNLKRDKVSSQVPAWIAPPVEGAPANRLGLAQWLVQPNHPLTARVTVNRFWQQLFGIGLVRTAEDFGLQGEHPSHPELLDWLSVDFVESGWDVKRCLKQMVMSRTYQQSSKVTAAKRKADPENRLLSWGPRFRLDAEVIRDQALALSGLMHAEVGGKSVKPYQPAGLWKPVGFGGSNTATFVQDKGEKLYRRSMYTFWKRTSPPPSMSTFDAPNRETCQVRRARTNTPLQALVLMNDVQFVEAARRFAERVMKEPPEDSSTEERIETAFRMVLTRSPKPTELAKLKTIFDVSLQRFEKQPDAAAKLLATGESARDSTLDAKQLAAWTMVTHILLNLSETVTKG